MMKFVLFIVLFLIAGTGFAQPLRDINYNYLYNPDEQVRLDLFASRAGTEWTVHYSLNLRDTSTTKAEDLTIEWGVRDNINDKESRPFYPEENSSLSTLNGSFKIPASQQPIVLVAKVVDKQLKRAWLFYKSLEPNSPVNAFVESRGNAIFRSFVSIRDSVRMRGIPNAVVSYYNDVFPTALPPFSEAQGKVSRAMKSDSTFIITEGQSLMFSKKGLYLIQSDTNAVDGITIRAEDDYPKFAKIQSLSPALVFITTAQEYNKLLQGKNEKKTFDRIVLGITNDQERAKRLMKNYFKRVELANLYFTSYKEGWKTDRGMVYVVFGLPDEVFKFNDREVWNYSLTKQKLSFSFIKSSSVFDPDNYVLIRDTKYQQNWYETIDLWRGSRF
jgi:GWxTD domain-containing protein